MTVMGTVGRGSRILYSSQFPWLCLPPSVTRGRDIMSAEMRQSFVLLSLTHQVIHALTHSLSPQHFLAYFCVLSRVSYSVFVSFVSFFLLICSLPLLIVYPLIWSSLFLVLYSPVLSVATRSGWHKNRTGGPNLPVFIHPTLRRCNSSTAKLLF